MLADRSYRTLMSRLAAAHGGKPWRGVAAIHPDWWTRECESDVSVLYEVEARVGRVLGVPSDVVRDPSASLAVGPLPSARFRLRKDSSAADVTWSARVGLAVARALAHNLRDVPEPKAIPADPFQVRLDTLATSDHISLGAVLDYAWSHGVIVAHLDTRRLPPGKTFQGLACQVEGRAVILIADRTKIPARQLFHVAHELGHHALGHVTGEGPVIDEEVSDDAAGDDSSAIEREANLFAARTITGRDAAPAPLANLRNPNRLASEARSNGATARVDPGHIIEAWARRATAVGVDDAYAIAGTAHKNLGTGVGGLEAIISRVKARLDLDQVDDMSLSALRCLSDIE